MVKYDVENTPIVDLVNNIILVAVKSRASDIHFDPLEDGLKIRMRIDGNLQDHTILPKESERNIITRIKLISGMNITENRLPQDGAIKGRIDNLDLDMRVSALPTNEGEKVVIRILDYSMSLEGLSKLDFSPINYQKVLRMTQIPNGIILVTGATGSGKSTTTYAMLQTLNNEQTNIITVEDPIEMNIEGINQVQVNSEIGMTFAAALRSILRQDPNVILIGEIRDSETARIAVRASITGHIVFSTVHTNDSLSTIERLLDMDVERYLLATALEGIISQKLARRLCPHCKKLRPTTPYEKKVFKDIFDINITEMWETGKCEYCSNGFLGRIAIQEVLSVNDGIRDIINKSAADKDELRRMVYEKNDTITLLEDGLDKVIKGFTTFEEIYKLIEIEDIVSSKRRIQEEQEELEKQKNLEQTDSDKNHNDLESQESTVSLNTINPQEQTVQEAKEQSSPQIQFSAPTMISNSLSSNNDSLSPSTFIPNEQSSALEQPKIMTNVVQNQENSLSSPTTIIAQEQPSQEIKEESSPQIQFTPPTVTLNSTPSPNEIAPSPSVAIDGQPPITTQNQSVNLTLPATMNPQEQSLIESEKLKCKILKLE